VAIWGANAVKIFAETWQVQQRANTGPASPADHNHRQMITISGQKFFDLGQ
jgi:hypothetical protein